MARTSFLFVACVAIVLLGLASHTSAVPCGGTESCPLGQCCGSNNICGTSDAYCGAGCQPELGTCKGYFSNLTVALSAPSLEVVDIVYDPMQPFMYVFVNVMGNLNVTKPGNEVTQMGPFPSMSAFKRALILRYNTATLEFVDNSQMGTYALGAGDVGQDFTFVRALWANGTVWAAYNLGPSQGTPATATVAFYKDSSNQYAMPQSSMGNTGILRIQTSTLIPNTTSSTFPGIFSFANLTSSSFHFEGGDLFLSGSFVQSPLQIPQLQINETIGVRGSCTNASHEAFNFQWCPGDEDGWDLQIGVNGNTGTVSTPHFVFSQNTGAAAEPRVQALSVSSDSEGAVYACYTTNNEFLVTADSGDHAFANLSSIAFNHSLSTPSDNVEVFCTIRTPTTFSFTSMARDGQISNILAGALPSASKQLYYSANVNSGLSNAFTTFNITAVQDVGQELGYTMQTASGGSAAITNVLVRPTASDIVVSGVFKGTLTGDVAAPILHVTGESATNNLFAFYYNRTDSPTQITPSAVFSLSAFGVNFLKPKSYHHSGSSLSQPKLLVTSTFTASQVWTYNNTFFAPTLNGDTQFLWGLYQPEATTVPGPIFVIPHPSSPVPSSRPPTASPTSTSTPTSSATRAFSPASILFVLATIFASCVLQL